MISVTKEDVLGKWIKLLDISNAIKAEMFKQLLENEEIEVVLINKKDTMYNFGEVELYVRDSQALKAHHLISKNEFKS